VTPRIGVLISGRGSNLQAIIDAVRAGALRAELAVVISNRAAAPGLARAREAGVEALFLNPREYADRDAYDRALADALRARSVSLVCLAGYMRLVGLPLLDAFPGGILNIHPSLLPAFRGLDAQKQALEHGVTISGATVHLVNADLDAGPIVMQAAVPVLSDDTVDTLSARILVEEHRIYPLAIAAVLGRSPAASSQSPVASSQSPVAGSQSPAAVPVAVSVSVEDAEAALVRAIPFARDDVFRVVQMRAGDDPLTRRLREAFPRATVKTFTDPFDAAALTWWDAMFGVDLVVAPFVMPAMTDAKKQYFYKAVADRASPRGGVLVVDRVDGAASVLLHHLIWLRHAGFTDVDCRWRVADVAVFGGFKRHAAAASAPPLPAGS
jgi:phosphoribosylglycinamide formyltransferase-1